MGMGLPYESDSSPFAELRNGASGVLGAPYEAVTRNVLQGGAECRLLLSWCSICSSLIQAVIAPTRRRPTRAFPTFLRRDQYISYIDSSSVSCPITFRIAVIPRAHNGFDGALPHQSGHMRMAIHCVAANALLFRDIPMGCSSRFESDTSVVEHARSHKAKTK